MLAQLPGLRINVCPGSQMITASCVYTNRVTRTEQAATQANPLRIRVTCPSDVYLDKMLVSKQGDPPFDINMVRIETVEAIQWFANRMQVPAEYNLPSAICGVLVIHTRKSP